MDLLEYHRTHRQEQDSWDLEAIDRAAREQDASFPGRVQTLLDGADQRFTDDLRTVVRGPLFEKLEALSRLYLASSPEQRVFIRSRLIRRRDKSEETHHNRQIASRLESFGLRAAVIGMREHSVEMVKVGLAGFAITDLESDVRETLMSITVLFHAAKSLDADAAALFREVAAISGPAFSAVLTDYAKRPAGLQTLGCMGWFEVQTPQGVGFQRTRPV